MRIRNTGQLRSRQTACRRVRRNAVEMSDRPIIATARQADHDGVSTVHSLRTNGWFGMTTPSLPRRRACQTDATTTLGGEKLKSCHAMPCRVNVEPDQGETDAGLPSRGNSHRTEPSHRQPVRERMGGSGWHFASRPD